MVTGPAPPGPLPSISSTTASMSSSSSSRRLFPANRLLRDILGESTPKLCVRKNFGAAHFIEIFCLVDGSSKLMAVPKNLISFFVIGRRSQVLFVELSLAILLRSHNALSVSLALWFTVVSVKLAHAYTPAHNGTHNQTRCARTMTWHRQLFDCRLSVCECDTFMKL